jgi:tartrate dehydrogenase/decarboxylase / D-malate dehydrogenase
MRGHMRHHNIAVIAGDGIGPEVVPEGVKVLQAAAAAEGGFSLSFDHFGWGAEHYVRTGLVMPPEALKQLESYDAIYLGAIGLPAVVPDHISQWGVVLAIRQGFDMYINLRPIRLLPGLEGVLRDKGPEDIDFVCVRENSEGEYCGVGGRVHLGTSREVAAQTSIFTRQAVERVVRYAFDLARSRPRKKLTSVTKSNVWQHAMVFWDEVVSEIAAEYPDVTMEKWLVDSMAARFITHPQTLDVVVCSNLFGDILTDVGGALQGSLGLPPAANIRPDRGAPSMFEPVHGSAPDIAGKGLANPIATIWAGSMMLDFLGEKPSADLVMKAIEAVTREGMVLTGDLGGTSTTCQVGDEIRAKLLLMAGT